MPQYVGVRMTSWQLPRTIPKSEVLEKDIAHGYLTLVCKIGSGLPQASRAIALAVSLRSISSMFVSTCHLIELPEHMLVTLRHSLRGL